MIIRKFSKKDLQKAKQFRDFINSIIKEDDFLMLNKKVSLKQEKEWLKKVWENIKKKKIVYLVAEHENSIIGTCHLEKNEGRESHVLSLGIALKKEYRNKGLGSKMVATVIETAKKRFKDAKMIRLEVFSTNRNAISFYKKNGFKKAARIPKQAKIRDKLVDKIVMIKELKKC